MRGAQGTKLLKYQSLLFNKSIPEKIIELSQPSDKNCINQVSYHIQQHLSVQQEILTLDKQFNINTHIFEQNQNDTAEINFNKRCKQILTSYLGGYLDEEPELPTQEEEQINYPLIETEPAINVQTMGIKISHKLISVTHVVSGPIWVIETNQQRNYLAVGGRDNIVHVYIMYFQNENLISSDIQYQQIDYSSIHYTKPKRKQKSNKKMLNQSPGSQGITRQNLVIKHIRDFSGHNGEIIGLQFNKCNQLLSTSVDNTIRIWSIVQYKCLGIIRVPETITNAQWDITDDNIIYALSTNKLYRCNIFIQKQTSICLQDNDQQAQCYFKLLQNDNYIYAISQHNVVVISKQTFRIIEKNLHVNSSRGKYSSPQHIMSATISDNGQNIAIISADNRIRIYDANTFTQIYKIRDVNTGTLGHYHNMFLLTKPGNDQKSQSPKMKQNKTDILEIKIRNQMLIYLSNKNQFSFSRIQNTNVIQKKNIFSIVQKKILYNQKKQEIIKEKQKQNDSEEFQCITSDDTGQQSEYLKYTHSQNNNNVFGQYLSKNVPQLQQNIVCKAQYQISQFHCFSQEVNKIWYLHESIFYCILGDYNGYIYIYQFQ